MILGGIVNILALTNPLFLMQIMDRIIPSQDIDTLGVLLVFACLAFLIMSWMEGTRQMLMTRMAMWLEQNLSRDAYDRMASDPIQTKIALQDIGTVSAFIRQSAVIVIDAPWSIIFMIVLWAIHPLFLVIALVASASLVGLSVVGWYSAKQLTSDAIVAKKEALGIVDALTKAGPVATAMGLERNLASTFARDTDTSLRTSYQAVARQTLTSQFARFLRQSVQIIVLALGAYLVLRGELSSGAMIAASIILGKALAPSEQIAASWAGLSSSLDAWRRIAAFFSTTLIDDRPDQIAKGVIKGYIQGRMISVPSSPGMPPLLDRISFDLAPGECLAIGGPSGAGKSILAEIIAGIRPPPMGSMAIDGVPYTQLSRRQVAAMVGYAPQQPVFFPGDIGKNIASFAAAPDPADILDAVIRSETEPLIRDTAQGFATPVDASGAPLSSGQLRRLALARALFGRPRLVVLDEPASDLDGDGEQALIRAIGTLKREGTAVVLIAQRAGLLAVADKLMMLDNGRLRDFGDRGQVLARLSLKRSQIDLQPTLGEVPRLIRWVEVQLNHLDDEEFCARSELFLVEVFKLLIADVQPESPTDAPIAIHLKVAQTHIRWVVTTEYDHHLFPEPCSVQALVDSMPQDTSRMTSAELGLAVAASAVDEIHQTLKDGRLSLEAKLLLERMTVTTLQKLAANG